ncbi:MAG: peptidylprolyl isomerase [Candidatus Edwardsbacteria bacterium]|nr:peptidylprolyl isomerase [Candidatus Edwardsbacteria bacterium]
MVMKQMRSQMKLVMWIVAVSFVVGFGFLITGTGGSLGGKQSKLAQGIAGEVNGQVITVTQYRQALNEAIKADRAKQGAEPNEAAIRELGDKTWQQLVSQALLQQIYRRLGIKVYDDEVVSIIRNSPPQDLMTDERLFTNGKFDISKYQAVVSNPQNLAWLMEYEKQIRDALPRQKLQMQVLSGVRVTDGEVNAYFLERNEKVRAQFIAVELGRLFDPRAEIPAPAIAAYYKAHQKDFKAPERVKLSYVLIPKLATAGDSAAARQKIDEISKELQSPGVKFEELAQTYSDDPGSAGKGGELGWFTNQQMVPEFEKAAFSLRPGQTSAPFASQFGWHIVRVDSVKVEKGKKMVKAAHILVSSKAGEETMSGLRTKAESFCEAARKDGLDKAAAEFNLQVIPTNYFQQGSYIPGLGVFPELMSFAFEEKTGSISPALENEQALVVALVADRKKEGIQPLADVESRIKMLVARETAKEQARETAAQIGAEIAGGKTLEQAARDNNLAVDTTGAISRASFVPKVGSQNEFFGAAFSLAPGAVSRPVATDQGAYVVKVIQKIPADQSQFAKERESIMQQLYQEKQKKSLEQWFADVERQAKIKDYRAGM